MLDRFCIICQFEIMNRLDSTKRALIVKMITEGNSLRAASRIAGVSINTVTKLVCELGEACIAYHDQHVVNLRCERVEMDEIWSFVGHKNKGKENPRALIHNPTSGDVWTWKCICAESKLIVGWHVGGRTFDNAVAFCREVAPRFAELPQISTDGLKSYPLAISYAFGSDIHYGRLIKIYGKDEEGKEICVGARKERVQGAPDMSQTCTSFIERANLTLRMANRRFARRTNAHSKKIENHELALGLHFFVYNFCRKHLSLKQTPAMAAGVTDHVWSMDDLLAMFDAYMAENYPAERPKTYKPRAEKQAA